MAALTEVWYKAIDFRPMYH